ncbi:MAG TPA: FkbM family methyltransferase [Candidatus Moranbacteria bacterium]|nr:FkbM family methyltransferase [Candidatus Moranbacteria bacterium]
MLKTKIKKLLSKSIIINKIYQLLLEKFDGYYVKSYSQEGEDMILRRLFEDTKKGFYVDIGAHHPQRFSNTQYFYKMGWTGINVDAMPGSMKKFEKLRPRDINLEMAVSDANEHMTYYAFNDSALNTFSDELSEIYKKDYKIIFKKDIETFPLSEILEKYLPKNKEIDFLSIDVENLELNVLKSNDWSKYMPKFILVEMLNDRIDSLQDNKIYNFLVNKNYRLISKTLNTAIFRINTQSNDICVE